MSRANHRARPGVLVVSLVLVLLVLLGACSLPTGGVATSVPADEVPYGLVTTTATPTATEGASPSTRGTVYLVDSQQHLVPLLVEVGVAPLRPLVQELLQRLALGPNERQRGKGLLTDLAPGSTLTLRSIDGGTATVELQAPVQDPTPVRFPVAIGQIVLTATSVIGVDRVRFVQEDGAPANVPVPPVGEVTTAPVRAEQLSSLLAPGTTTPARLVPLPAGDPGPSPSSTTSSS
ncbi:MAG: GerMN domain-containing protein [Actinomycetota bacterium]|nr:GerMN domain-containing protein [Actinomycetota bacterium]